ncbi:hypothetical protein Rcae01_01223 [Novipirellula caenicola]|uniref:Uncharacterized protein n=1 Tax=Novipirellula caenicola TaxID=1536901 RepID=A0ABP9VMA2_9BACT
MMDFLVRQSCIRRTRKSVVRLNQQAVNGFHQHGITHREIEMLHEFRYQVSASDAFSDSA